MSRTDADVRVGGVLCSCAHTNSSCVHIGVPAKPSTASEAEAQEGSIRTFLSLSPIAAFVTGIVTSPVEARIALVSLPALEMRP